MILKLQTHYPDFLKYNFSFFDKILRQEANKSEYHTLDEYVAAVYTYPDICLSLAEALSISYSIFFRDEISFAVLKEYILPDIIKMKKAHGEREIRIWSAACAAGQEPYSIAMLVNEMMKGDDDPLSFRIFATDNNTKSLDRARQGKYSLNVMQNLPLKFISAYFQTVDDDTYQINKELKSCVQFAEFDLFDELHSSPVESVFGAFDIIFCKNILYYYSYEMRCEILKKLDTNLVSGGYLFVSPSEKAIVSQCLNSKILPYAPIFKRTKALI